MKRSVYIAVATGATGALAALLYFTHGKDMKLQQAAIKLDDSAVVARVEGQPITAQQLRQEMIRSGTVSGLGQPSEEDRQKALDTLIEREVLAVAGRRAGFDKDPELKESYTRQLGELFWRAQLKGTQVLLDVEDSEAQAYYREHEQEFKDPNRARGAVIAFYLAPNASAADKQAARKRAEQARKEADALPSEEPFLGQLPTRYSSDPATARRQGDMGWIGEGTRVYQFEPKVVEALFALEEPGAVSSVIAGDRGLYLVKLVGREGGETRKFEQVEPQIRTRLQAAKTQELRERLHAQIREGMRIDVDEKALLSVAARAARDAQQPTPPAFPLAVNAPNVPEATP